MVEVIPLKYGVIFKRIFSQPEIFKAFVKDVLDLELNIDKVHTEYQYPEPIGFVRSTYDLFAEDVEQRVIVEIQQVKEDDFFDRFLYYHLISLVEQVGGFQEYGFDRTVYTIVLLTSTPRDGSVNFSCAISDMNPIDEHGDTVDVYPHRLVFLCPRQINEHTPSNIKKWLAFIDDSLDGKMEDADYADAPFQQILNNIRKRTIDPALLSEIKDEAAWEKAKARFMREGREEGREKGLAEGIEKGLAEGREEGREKGLAEGREEGREEGERLKALAMAKTMLTDGMPLEIVLKYTGLQATDLQDADEA